MSFILLLLISLLTFTSVERRLASIQLEQLLAQQNALLGLQVAIGELQKLTGPDSRATAPARVLSNDDGVFGAPGNRFWTAVWDSQSEELMGYLVAGGSVPDASDAVNPFDFEASLLNGRAADPGHALLVGQKEATASGSVMAPRQPIQSAGGGADKGGYSWWVGDLSARTTLRSPRPEAIEGAPDYLHAQRSAPEALFPEALNDATRFDQLSSRGQMPLLSNGDADALLAEHFHDLTIHSVGLQVNTRDGGLRRSLNAAFEGQMDLLHQFHADRGGAQIFGPQRPEGDDVGGPRWTQLQSYYNSPDAMSGSAANASQLPRPTTDDAGGLYPIPLHVQYWVHASLITGSGGAVRTRLHVLPRIAVWNPHNLTITGSDYYFSFREPLYPDPNANNNINIHLAYNRPGEPARSEVVDQSVPFQFNQAIRLSMPDLGPGEVVLLTPSVNASGSAVELSPGDRDSYYYLDHPNEFTLPDDAENVELRVSPLSTFANTPQNNQGRGNFTHMVLSLGPTRESVLRPIRGPGAQRLNELYHTVRYTPVYGFGELPSEAKLNQTTFPANQPYDASGEPPDLVDLFNIGTWPSVGFYVSMRQPENTFQSNPWRRLPWLAHYNPRGRLSGRAPQDNAVSPVTGRMNTSVNGVPGYAWAISRDKDFYDTVFRFPPRIGLSDSLGPARSILFEIPRRKSDLRSIGQLTHAHLSIPSGNVALRAVNPSRFGGEDGPMLNETNRPAYAIGNSLADPHLGREAESELDQLGRIYRDDWPDVHSEMPAEATAYDWSFLLNEELFDRYFLSTASEDWFDQSWTGWSGGEALPALPQSRYRLHVPEGLEPPETGAEWKQVIGDFDKAAAFIQIDGAFNVNSTSVDAWEAELSGLIGADQFLTGVTAGDSPFVRAAFPLEKGFTGGSNAAVEVHAGYRQLNRDEVRRLAVELVAEIRERGPVFTLADFINRDPSSPSVAHRLRGRIAAAILRAGINEDLQNPFSSQSDYDEAPQNQGSFRDFATVALAGPRLENAPGFLSSADIVARIGGNWTTRGDSFVIRAYGDSGRGGVGGGGAIAVCEAVVQRQISAHVDTSGSTVFEPGDVFGRRYKIISLKWLSQNEL